MELINLRYNTETDYTDGIFYNNDKFRCYTIEDGPREEKVYGKTRIPDGTYEVTLRTEGDFHNRYLRRYGSNFHKGMLWIRDVPGFEYILIHVGNSPKDTAGCLLVGDEPIRNKAFISGSRNAYQDIYPEIAEALENGEEVTITFKTIG